MPEIPFGSRERSMLEWIFAAFRSALALIDAETKQRRSMRGAELMDGGLKKSAAKGVKILWDAVRICWRLGVQMRIWFSGLNFWERAENKRFDDGRIGYDATGE
jgi:hypothetical protein